MGANRLIVITTMRMRTGKHVQRIYIPLVLHNHMYALIQSLQIPWLTFADWGHQGHLSFLSFHLIQNSPYQAPRRVGIHCMPSEAPSPAESISCFRWRIQPPAKESIQLSGKACGKQIYLQGTPNGIDLLEKYHR